MKKSKKIQFGIHRRKQIDFQLKVWFGMQEQNSFFFSRRNFHIRLLLSSWGGGPNWPENYLTFATQQKILLATWKLITEFCNLNGIPIISFIHEITCWNPWIFSEQIFKKVWPKGWWVIFGVGIGDKCGHCPLWVPIYLPYYIAIRVSRLSASLRFLAGFTTSYQKKMLR